MKHSSSKWYEYFYSLHEKLYHMSIFTKFIRPRDLKLVILLNHHSWLPYRCACVAHVCSYHWQLNQTNYLNDLRIVHITTNQYHMNDIWVCFRHKQTQPIVCCINTSTTMYNCEPGTYDNRVSNHTYQTHWESTILKLMYKHWSS